MLFSEVWRHETGFRKFISSQEYLGSDLYDTPDKLLGVVWALKMLFSKDYTNETGRAAYLGFNPVSLPVLIR